VSALAISQAQREAAVASQLVHDAYVETTQTPPPTKSVQLYCEGRHEDGDFTVIPWLRYVGIADAPPQFSGKFTKESQAIDLTAETLIAFLNRDEAVYPVLRSEDIPKCFLAWLKERRPDSQAARTMRNAVARLTLLRAGLSNGGSAPLEIERGAR
jgi:hypothetical protein